ncbi:MAG: glycosyl hydrolase family 28-related protein, partial [Oscillospiraceae bacterium]
GIDAVGNEMENLYFDGGEYGIYTGKCSPGWPFVLTDTDFANQRKASMCVHQSGITLRRVSFADAPCAVSSLDGFWDKQILVDCVLSGIKTGFEIATENNTCTQYNMRNVLCINVPRFAYFKESATCTSHTSENFIVNNFTHGYISAFGEEQMHKKTIFKAQDFDKINFAFTKDIPYMPAQESWVSAKDFGAVGDGITDDTAALQAAAACGKAIYLPQGKYIVTDTIVLSTTSAIIGLNPISTQLILPDNSPLFAGIGSPRAILETPVNGVNYVSGIAIDTNARNPRAVACKWQCGTKSYMYDIKFVGGHGRISKDSEFLPSYNATRTADYDSERPWDTQFWSLWVTNGGGGVFKNIWTANPYAEAGIFISETSCSGTMYQVSSEHHVRHEILMRNAANWSFYAMQTEEEVAEGSHCQPFELCDCENILFANLYAFRVIWVDNSYPCVIKTWNCKNIEIQNMHNFTQMKFTIDNVLADAVSGKKVGFWQLANLYISDTEAQVELPQDSNAPKKLCDGFDYVDAMCKDSAGNIYICDSRLRRIYKYDVAEKTFHFVTSMHYRPLSLACDSNDNLLVVVEYKPVPHATKDGKAELSFEEYGERSKGDWGACFYPFYRKDRRVRVYTTNAQTPEQSMIELLPQKREGLLLDTMYYPANQWRDNNDILDIVCISDEKCYLAPDQKTGIVHSPSLARATGLIAAKNGKEIYMADEYNKRILRLNVDSQL